MASRPRPRAGASARVLAGILVVVLAAAAASGCGDSEEEAAGDSPTTATGEGELAPVLERAIAETTSDPDQYPRPLAADCAAGAPEGGEDLLGPDRGNLYACTVEPGGEEYVAQVLPNGSFVAAALETDDEIRGCCVVGPGGADDPRVETQKKQ